MTLPQFKNIGIETTSICNSDCAVCPRGPYFTGAVTTMTSELFERIILDIHSSARPQYLVFGGMGDPSCDKKLIERLRFCREYAPELALVVDSNMAVWKTTFTDAILEERLLDVLRASIFGISDEGSQRAYGVAGQAAKARRAMDYLIKRNKEMGNPVKLGVYTLLGEHDDEEVEQIKRAFWDDVEEFEI